MKKSLSSLLILWLSAAVLFSCAALRSETAVSRLLPDPVESCSVTAPRLAAEPIAVAAPEVDSEAWAACFSAMIELLKTEFPDGAYWNHRGAEENGIGVTGLPCDHFLYGERDCQKIDCASTRACGFDYGTQCAGFAGLLSDRIFGADAPVTRFTDYDAIRPGDQARINGDTHTVFILEKTDEYVVVAECNADYRTCQIRWGRVIPRKDLRGYYITRRTTT